MELFPFQVAASRQIADRFDAYMRDPLTTTRTRIVPFYQTLSAITGSGKTLILADAVEQIRGRLPLEAIVLWISKGRVVVLQTLANLADGKYRPIVPSFDIMPLQDCKAANVENSGRGLILIATDGKFNQKDKEKGDRKIFKVQLDVDNASLWTMLKSRRDQSARRRPLIVIYDEGHNLSDQKATLLMELEPDAIIAASATMALPQALSPMIDRLRTDKGWADSDFVTAVSSVDVVNSGLVKRHILVGGYLSRMETAVDDLLEQMKKAEKAAKTKRLPFLPKSIYVTTTNAVDGVPIKEDAARRFVDRQARPILVWRHLVENRGVDPSTIAVYCDLKFDDKHPPPDAFNLFSGGDSDYENFTDSGYSHIIFNLSLQEGWDDRIRSSKPCSLLTHPC